MLSNMENLLLYDCGEPSEPDSPANGPTTLSDTLLRLSLHNLSTYDELFKVTSVHLDKTHFRNLPKLKLALHATEMLALWKALLSAPLS